MGRRVRRHPIEDWADTFARKDLMNVLVAGTLTPNMAKPATEDDQPLTNLANATAISFAHMVREGRAHIVHVADEVYDDVLESKLEDNDNESLMLPWRMFAIETKDNETWQAFVVTTWANARQELPDALASTSIDDDSATEYVRLLDEVASQILPGTDDDGSPSCGMIPVLAPIPTNQRMLAQARFMADTIINATNAKGLELLQDNRRVNFEGILERMPKIPIEVGWGLRDENPMSMNDMLRLALFVLAKNTTVRTTYEPNPKIRDNPKKRRSKATMHEVGFEWTEAYREYRKAISSGDKGATGGHVRPHTRRGHFHRFRTGPRDAPVPTYVTHWIPPTLVGRGQTSNAGHVVR